MKAGVYTADAALPAETEKPGAEVVAQRLVLQVQKLIGDYRSYSCFKTEKPKAAAEKVADLPTNEEKQLRPKEVKFDTWVDLLKMGTRKTSG